MNADPAELHKFSELAHRWWDTQSEFRPLHEINPLRLNWMTAHVDLEGACVLDVGCGGGILSEGLARAKARVTGIDLSDKALSVARLHLFESELEVNYLKIPVEALAEQQPAHFDVVTCMEMLEHVPDPASVVAACARLLKPGGTAFFSTLNRNPKSYLFAILGAEYVLGLLPKGTHDYEKFIKPSELSGFCRKAGLCVGEIIGLHYNPLTQAYRLGPGVGVNYLMQTQKPLSGR
jgi:2-polyprenyl-6-hydroxyphenyl methylase / 3-demethylubiquinone-9 3-methyltransferase